MIIVLIFFQLNYGYLNVQADQDSLPIYVDNKYIGKTPIIKFPLMPDKYTVGFFPEDSIEAASWQLKNGSVNALWKVVKYGEGVVNVEIAADKSSTVQLSYEKVRKASNKAKLLVGGCLGGAFILGVLTTLALQALF